VVLAASLAAAACGSTVDSVGYSGAGPGGIKLQRLTMPAKYPNVFHDWLGKTDQEISAKITDGFNQLFHGDPDTQAIYYPMGSTGAEIKDIYHKDVRTEGIGWAMMIAVQQDRRDEFDQMWTYATIKQAMDGPSEGYFTSFCDAQTSHEACTDPFGMQQFVTALLFAHGRWGDTGKFDYGAAALKLLNVFRHQEDINGGIVEGVTDVFDPVAALPYHQPDVTAATQTRPSILMPAYYELWAQATGDPFWSRAAASAREFWKRSADPKTGLFPVRSTFEGVPVADFKSFQPEAYRVELNLALDALWFGRDPWQGTEADRLLGFFSDEGFNNYGTSYELNGKPLNKDREPALILFNGVTASISTASDRMAYVQAVWDRQVPSGSYRYYQGLVYLLVHLVLGGQFRVW
jgi:oligosaccharide reducing-end xylanase